MRNLDELDIRHFGSVPPGPPSIKRIGDLEKKLGRKLPTQYIELIQFSNGGSPLNSRFNEAGFELEIDSFFSLHESLNELDESKKSSDIYYLVDLALPFTPEVVLPIAGDALGNYFCLDLTDPGQENVGFWDHDPPGYFHLSNSFESFIDSLN